MAPLKVVNKNWYEKWIGTRKLQSTEITRWCYVWQAVRVAHLEKRQLWDDEAARRVSEERTRR